MNINRSVLRFGFLLGAATYLSSAAIAQQSAFINNAAAEARYQEMKTDAQRIGCAAELKAVTDSDLMSNSGVLVNPIFRVLTNQGWNSTGSAARAFQYLVVDGDDKIRAALQRPEVDSARAEIGRRLNISREAKDIPDAANWRVLERAVSQYHLCTMKARFGIDIAAENSTRRAAEASSRDEFSKEIVPPTANSYHYACSAKAAPKSNEDAQTHYFFNEDGTGKVVSIGLPEDNPSRSLCRLASYKWSKLDVENFQLNYFGSERRDAKNCPVLSNTGTQTILFRKPTLVAGVIQVNEFYGDYDRNTKTLKGGPNNMMRNDGSGVGGLVCITAR